MNKINELPVLNQRDESKGNLLIQGRVKSPDIID